MDWLPFILLSSISYYISMSNFPNRGTISLNKSKNQQDPQENNHFDQALRLIDQLWTARLIDNIARPVDKKIKEEHIQKYKNTMVALHERLKTIMNSASEKNSTRSSRSKTAVTSINCKPREWTKYIRSIQNRYNQVLQEGSFKFFKKICMMLGLRYDTEAMEPINIEKWANLCQNQKSQSSCCC